MMTTHLKVSGEVSVKEVSEDSEEQDSVKEDSDEEASEVLNVLWILLQQVSTINLIALYLTLYKGCKRRLRILNLHE
jgi:hypothetical protein